MLGARWPVGVSFPTLHTCRGPSPRWVTPPTSHWGGPRGAWREGPGAHPAAGGGGWSRPPCASHSCGRALTSEADLVSGILLRQYVISFCVTHFESRPQERGPTLPGLACGKGQGLRAAAQPERGGDSPRGLKTRASKCCVGVVSDPHFAKSCDEMFPKASRTQDTC